MEVSIIIPVFNRRDVIARALESLVNQTFTDFEVIVVDDGSTDESVEVIQQYCEADSRFKYFYQRNKGVSVARNNGISRAKGDYLCFLDSDDYYEPTFLAEMHKEIKYRMSDVCYCGYNIVKRNIIKNKKTHFTTKGVLVKYILGKVNVHTTGWMIKRNYLMENKIFYVEGVSWGEDFEFFCEVLSRTNAICYIRGYLTNYTVEPTESALSTFNIDKMDKDFESINRLINISAIKDRKDCIKALVGYRLPALLTYRLIGAFETGLDIGQIKKYYLNYKKEILKMNYSLRLRNVKLFVYKLKLIFKIMNVT
nr:glycosyltransferase family 2 protein [Cohnella thailandensis]